MVEYINIFRYLKIVLIFSVSIFLSILFELVPLPYTLSLMKPDLTIIVLLYWVITMPYVFGTMYSCFIGLMFDVLTFQPLGMHAFGMIFITYLAIKYSKRIMLSPLLQQGIYIAIFLFVYKVCFTIFCFYRNEEIIISKQILSLITDFITWSWVRIILDAWITKLSSIII